MNNKTLKRVVAFLATALLVCSCVFAAEIGEVTYDAKTGALTVPFTAGEGATKAALLVKNAAGDIVALNQQDKITGTFNEVIDTTKLAVDDVLTVSVGDNAAASEKADSEEVNVVAPVVEYTITFVDEDGTTVLQTGKVAEGTMPVAPADPTKAANEKYTYTFAGWSPAIAEVTGDATYTATYTEAAREYTVVFYAEDGVTVLSEQKLIYGATPVEPEAPAKEGFTFKGWGKDIVAVTGDATYTATYEATPIIPDVETFTVIFMNGATEVSKVEEVAAGTALSTLVPAEPTKAASGKKRYAFIGWYLDDAFATKMADNTVAADATLYAKFSMIGVHGDANADGNVNTFDLVELKNFFKDKTAYAEAGKKANTAIADCLTGKGKTAKFGDANADGNVNTFDLVELKNYFKDKTGYLDQGKFASTDMKVVKD